MPPRANPPSIASPRSCASPSVRAAVPLNVSCPFNPASCTAAAASRPARRPAEPDQRSSPAPSATSTRASGRITRTSPHRRPPARTGPATSGAASRTLRSRKAVGASSTQSPMRNRSLTAASVPRNPSLSQPRPDMRRPTTPMGVVRRIRPSATARSIAGKAKGLPDGVGSSRSSAPSETRPFTSSPRSRTRPARTPTTLGPDGPIATRVSTQSATRSGSAGSPITTLVSRCR